MSQVPMEYTVFKKKFFKSVEKALGDDLVGIIVYGGSSTERIFSGVSDVDFFILLKSISTLSKPLSEVYSALNGVISEFVTTPLFAAILDYDIYTEDQIPKGDDLNGFSAIRAVSLATGELLVGSNPFEGKKISEDDLRRGARQMVQDYLSKLTATGVVFQFEDEEGDSENEIEKEFNAVDAILSSMQAYLIYENSEYITMPDIVLQAETEPTDGFDNELIVDAGLLRQGVEKKIDDFYNKAIDFCGNILNKLN